MKKLNYPLIVSDFDGTLVNSDGTITPENQQAIAEYIQAGGVFAISTGRMPSAILPHARNLGLKGLLCCGQGAVILDIESGEVIFENRLSMETTLEACRKLEEMDLSILVCDLMDFYANKTCKWLDIYETASKTTAIRVTDRKLSQFLEERRMAAYKLLALVDPADNARVFEALKAASLPDCDITKSIDFLVEIVSPITSKGTAITYLAETYGIPIEKTVAVGDNLNDISMIERAGLGVAVANAEDELKALAGYVCEYTNGQSAIAKIIGKFGFAEA